MKPILFYDGGCALCHGFVRWLVKRDPAAIFDFAPLQGATFQRLIPASERTGLPDSAVLRAEDGRLYLRSDAVLYALRHLGRNHLAGALAVLPRPLRDLGYDFIARVRFAVFGRKSELCPLVPPELRGRFLE